MNDFITLIWEGFRLAGNLGKMVADAAKAAADTVKAAVLGYFTQVKVWTIRFAIAAAIPLLIIIPCLLFKLPLGGLYGAYVIWIVLLTAAELLLLWPMFLIWRQVEEHLPKVASDLKEWLDFIRSVVFNGLSFGIFVTLFPVWRAPGTFPLLLLVLLCWLTLPACGVSDFCKRIYPSVRAIQLLFLAGLLVMQMAFPQQMKLRGWDSSIKIGKILTGSIVQKDITSEWKSLRWVDNDGEPMVWYSGSPSDGFHLWAAPGRDPRGEELRPMTERKIQDQVVAALQESDRRAQQEQAAKDAEQRRLAEIEKQKQVEADKVRQAAAEAERIRLAVEEAKRRAEQEALAKQTAEKQAELARQTAETQRRDYLARYRRSESLRGAGPGRSAAIFILGDKSQKNEAVGAALAGSLRQPELSVATDFFKPAFGTDGLVEQLLTGSRETGAKLELTNSLDVLLLGRISTSYSTNEALQNLITAESKLELVALSAASLEKLHATEWQSQGAGFKPEDARAAAEERLQKSLPADSLSAFRKTISSMLR